MSFYSKKKIRFIGVGFQKIYVAVSTTEATELALSWNFPTNTIRYVLPETIGILWSVGFALYPIANFVELFE